MAEQLDLPAPWGPQTTQWRVQSVVLERGLDPALAPQPMMSAIRVALVGQNGQRFTHVWSGETAEAMIVALNKANLNPATGGATLERRILNRLIADAVFPGTVSGSAD